MRKRKTGKKHLAWLLLWCMLLELIPSNVFALRAHAQETDVPQTQGEVSRVAWLHELTTLFEMKVEEDNYPDNYFTDIDATSAYYYDVMLATEFGLIDVEAGEPLYPENAATREFAAHTLNVCLGLVADEVQYTFAEVGSVTYPQDIQMAIDEEWLALSDGKFLPNEPITEAEKTKMLAYASEIREQEKFDAEHVNQYELQHDVKQLPQGAVVEMTDIDEYTLRGTNMSLQAGDKIAIVQGGFPVVKKIESITALDMGRLLKTSSVEPEEAFVNVDIQVDNEDVLTEIKAYNDAIGIKYIVGGTEEQRWEDGRKYPSLQAVGDQEISAVELYSKGSPNVTVTDDLDGVQFSAKLSNGKAKARAANIGFMATYEMDALCSVILKEDVLEQNEIKKSIPIAKIPTGVGMVVVSFDMALDGALSFNTKYHIKIGLELSVKKRRLIHDFQKKSFTIQAKVDGKLGFKIQYKLNAGFAEGSVYTEAGAKTSAKAETYTDGKAPAVCLHAAAYLYWNVGVDVKANLAFFKTKFKLEYPIYSEKDSPVRVYFHYEDGKAVQQCTRDLPSEETGGGGGSSGGTGSSSSFSKRKYKYYTPATSQYGYNGESSGWTSTGEEYKIFDYTLDGDGNATITGYHGNVSALNIPAKLDGHTVVGIDRSVFEKKAKLQTVVIPDSVRYIGKYAFRDCKNLSMVNLPKSLSEVGYCAFDNCESLSSIEIPKALEKTEALYAWSSGIFNGCTNLKTVTFEKGSTSIANDLFYGCLGIEKVVIPDTVTEIKDSAFEKCENLKEVIIPDAVRYIGEYAFRDCKKLSVVNLPKSLSEVGYCAFDNCESLSSIEIPKALEKTEALYSWNSGIFNGCTNLKTVTFEKGSTSIANDLFYGCPGIEKVVIPDTITEIKESAFEKCENLKEVIIPDSVRYIGEYTFRDCKKLSVVNLPKNLTEVGCCVFDNCESLSSIEIPKSLKKTKALYSWNSGIFNGCTNLKTVTFEKGSTKIVNHLFYGCPGIEQITIPSNITEIQKSAFEGCSNLKKVIMPDGVTTIGDSAFNTCTSLEEISIPDSVTDMGIYIFGNCTKLKKVKLPKDRINLTKGTFAGCSSLETITLPDTVQYIREKAFQEAGLKEIHLPDSVVEIDANAFNNCDSLIVVDMPESVASIGMDAFSHCDKLTSITIPDSVTSLGSYAFANCEVLEKVTLGRNLTAIPEYAFYQCPALDNVVIPYRVTKINGYAYANCTGLKSVTLPRALTSIASNAFSYPTKMTVYGIQGTYAQTWADSVGAKFVHQEKPATGVTFEKNELQLLRGESYHLVWNVVPADFTDVVTWKSGDTDVVTVTEDGTIKAVGVGSTTIKLVVGSVSASCKVTVIQPVTSISLNKSSISLDALETYTLVATTYPSNAQDARVTWSSSDSSIATVDENGLVTGIKKGTAVITATTMDGSELSKSCDVIVKSTAYFCDTIEKLQSPHNYEANCRDYWVYQMKNAGKIAVTFDEKTEVEDGFDYLYLYDAEGELVGKYTGKELAGKRVEIPGDTVKIQLISDDATQQWGFQVVKVSVVAKKYTITYHLGGGVNHSANPESYTSESETIVLQKPSYAGYTFMGWYLEQDYKTKVTQIETGSKGDLHLYAKWKANTYTVTFKKNGATSGKMKDKVYQYGTKYTLPAVSYKRKGYTFKSWNTKKNGAGKSYKNKASVINLTKTNKKVVTLYACWKPITYKVKFNGNGATSGKVSALKGCKYGKEYKLPTNQFKRTGYVFKGWNTKKDGSGKMYKNKAAVKNLASKDGKTVVLYAQWKKK